MFQKMKDDLAQIIKDAIHELGYSLDDLNILGLVETPKIYEHGHFALPLFQLAKRWKMNPNEIAKSLEKKIVVKTQSENQMAFVKSVQAMGGYLNFILEPAYLQKVLFHHVTSEQETLGQSELGRGKKILVDYSSPNIAKPMHVGHLRATMIGRAIVNLAKTQCFHVESVNHIGDWGTQFGKLASAYKRWHGEYDLSERPIDSLLKMYVRFHEEAKKNPNLEVEGAQEFLLLERGDSQTREIWKMIVDLSLKDFDRLYRILDVQHDHVLGESFYNDKLEDVVKRLEAKNLLRESEGARVVFFEESENMPPCIIKKSDGASIYATRDLAAAIYRHESMGVDSVLYVVGQDQSLHFRQVFRVLQLLGYDWARDLHHISFGFYRFKEGKFSTREGRVMLFEDILNHAMELVREMIENKNPHIQNKEKVIEQVAVGAVVFNDLINDRSKNVEFNWSRAISIDGDSGPYVQYSVVRCRSLMRKFGGKISQTPSLILDAPEETRLIYRLTQLDHIFRVSFMHYKPNFLAQFLLDLCSDFSHFYHSCRILNAETPELVDARIGLVWATEKILVRGLNVLGIPTPEEM